MLLERKINTMWLVATDVFWNGRVFCSSAQYVSKENFVVFRLLSRSTNKPCGKHMRTKKSSHPCGCFEFADVREGTFFFLVGCRAGVSEGGSSVKVSSKRGGSYLFVSYLREGSHTFSRYF